MEPCVLLDVHSVNVDIELDLPVDVFLAVQGDSFASSWEGTETASFSSDPGLPQPNADAPLTPSPSTSDRQHKRAGFGIRDAPPNALLLVDPICVQMQTIFCDPLFPSKWSASVTSKYKTRMCGEWQRTSHCRCGAHCTFAHGEREMRTKRSNEVVIIMLLLFMVQANQMYETCTESNMPLPRSLWWMKKRLVPPFH